MDTPSRSKGNAPTILIILMVVIIAAFLLLDFRLIKGQTKVSSQVSTFAFGIDKGNQLSTNQALDVYVIGGTEIDHDLAKALPLSLGAVPNTSAIEIQDGTPSLSEDSVLVIDLQQSYTLWTPFYSRTDITVQIAYASDGEVDWIDEESVDLTSGEAVVRVRGDYEMNASAYGMMSLPGYRSFLATSMADQIATSLIERLSNPNP